MSRVLDSSAVLAFLLGEAGGERLGATRGAAMSLVTLTEVAQRLLRVGIAASDMRETVRGLGVRAHAPDFELAMDAAALVAVTDAAGLSLGDRYCLALARRERLPAVTGDRAWARIAEAVGVEIELIR